MNGRAIKLKIPWVMCETGNSGQIIEANGQPDQHKYIEYSF